MNRLDQLLQGQNIPQTNITTPMTGGNRLDRLINSGLATPQTPRQIEGIPTSTKIPQGDTQQVQTSQISTQKSPIGFFERARLSFGSEEGKKRRLEELGFQVSEDGEGKLLVSKGKETFRVDPKGFEIGDIADLFGKALPFAGSVLGAIPGLATAVPTGGVSIPLAVGGGAAGGGIGEIVRQALGGFLGVQGGVSGAERVKEIGKESIFGAAAGLGGGVAKLAALGGKTVAPTLARRVGAEALGAGTFGGTESFGRTLVETGDVGKAATSGLIGGALMAPLGPAFILGGTGIGKAVKPVVGKAVEAIEKSKIPENRFARFIKQNVLQPTAKVFESFGPSGKKITNIQQNAFTKQQTTIGKTRERFNILTPTVKKATPLQIQNAAAILEENKLLGSAGLKDVESLIVAFETANSKLDDITKQIMRDTFEATRISSKPLADVGARFIKKGVPTTERDITPSAIEARKFKTVEEFIETTKRPSVPLENLKKTNPEFIKQISNPDGTIKIYRNVGRDKTRTIKPKDYVTYNKEYAIRFGTPDTIVIEKNVPIKDLRILTGMDSTPRGEMFYNPKSQLTDIFNQAKKGVVKKTDKIVRIAERENPFFPEFNRNVIERKPATLELAEKLATTNKKFLVLPEGERIGAALAEAEELILKGKGITRLGVAGTRKPVGFANIDLTKVNERLPQTADEFLGTLSQVTTEQSRRASTIQAYLDAGVKLSEKDKTVLEKLGPDALITRLQKKLINQSLTELQAGTKGAGTEFIKDATQRTKIVLESKKLLTEQLAIINTVLQGGDIASLLKKLQATKLSFSAIPNSFQFLNTMLASDFPSIAKAFSKLFTAEGQRLGVKAGSTAGGLFQAETGFRQAQRTIAKSGFKSDAINFMEKFVNKFLLPFRMTEEKFLRPWAALTAKEMAEKALQTKNFNIVADIVSEDIWNKALKTGKFAENDLLELANRFINKTQFGFNPLEYPAFFNTPLGSVFFQFKTFIFRQGGFLWDQVVREALPVARGGLGRPGRATRNLAILLTMFPAGGAAIAAIRRGLRGEELNEFDQSAVRQYFEFIGNTGGLGIVGDLINSMDARRFGEFMAGPTFTELSQILEAVPELAGIFTGDFDVPLEAIGRLTAQRFGGLGGAVRAQIKE